MASLPEDEVPVVIHAWSAPRSLSTSLMYSFAQRDDMEVLDEPLYANFLRFTGVDRPYPEELLSKMEPDGNKVIKEVIFGPGKKTYRYCKHVSKHRLPNLSNDNLMKRGKHFILIRNPLKILPSLDKITPPSFLELGIGELAKIYSELCQLGSPPPIIDADDLQQEPETVLSKLCDDLGIPFQRQMLKWEAGPKAFDGVWAPWWYGNVHKSTGFAKPRLYPLTFPFAFYDLLEQTMPFYNMMKLQVRRKVGSLEPSILDPLLPVPANKKLLVWVGDRLLPRNSAKVSVFDSVVQGGDAVYEGLHIYNGKAFKLDEHLERLLESAKAMAFINVPSLDWIKEAVFKTLTANGMFDSARIRLTLTNGNEVTTGMSPCFNIYGCTLIVVAEWKPSVYDNSQHGIKLVTNPSRHNSLNIEGNLGRVEDDIMLDKNGFVSETTSTNVFMVKQGIVLTPQVYHCLPSITRATVMDLVLQENLILHESRISLSEFHAADEVWTTGTLDEITPVLMIDNMKLAMEKLGQSQDKFRMHTKS